MLIGILFLLLCQVLSASEEEAGIEAEPTDKAGGAAAAGRKPRSYKKTVSMAEFAGGDGMTYMEFGTAAGGRPAAKPKQSEKAAELRKKLNL